MRTALALDQGQGQECKAKVPGRKAKDLSRKAKDLKMVLRPRPRINITGEQFVKACNRGKNGG